MWVTTVTPLPHLIHGRWLLRCLLEGGWELWCRGVGLRRVQVGTHG
jgi:hypothetical protein